MCKKYTKNKNPIIQCIPNGMKMLSPSCVVCDSKKSKFLKEQEPRGLLSRLGLKTHLSKIQSFGDI